MIFSSRTVLLWALIPSGPKKLMRRLYAPFSRNRDKMLFMNVKDAEMTKYAANSMLATKISFMNEISNLCERLGVDVENVRKGIGFGFPHRVFIYLSGMRGYGGSCFPKDVKALVKTSRGYRVCSHASRSSGREEHCSKTGAWTKSHQPVRAGFGRQDILHLGGWPLNPAPMICVKPRPGC